jgi:hypothetical protein
MTLPRVNANGHRIYTKHTANTGPSPLKDGSKVSKQLPRLIDLAAGANDTRNAAGAFSPDSVTAFQKALPVLSTQANGHDAALIGLAARYLSLDPSELKLTDPPSPGFSGAAIRIVSEANTGKRVGVVKVAPPAQALDSISSLKFFEGTFDSMPQVRAMARLDQPGPQPNNSVVQVMDFADGFNIATEKWWQDLKGNAQVPIETMSRVGAAVAQMHSALTAAAPSPDVMNTLVSGGMTNDQFRKFMNGAALAEALPELPLLPTSTAEYLKAGGLVWLAAIERMDSIKNLGILDFPRIEAKFRELIPQFLKNPGPASISHADLHNGQLQVGEDKITIFDFDLTGRNVKNRVPTLPQALDSATEWVNTEYFMRYAGFSDENIARVKAAYRSGYTSAGGTLPPEHATRLLEMIRQTWVVSLFANLSDAKPSQPNPADVRNYMVKTLRSVAQ